MRRALAGRASVPFDVPGRHQLRGHRPADRQAGHRPSARKRSPRRFSPAPSRPRSATCTGDRRVERSARSGRSEGSADATSPTCPTRPSRARIISRDEPGSLRRRRRRARARASRRRSSPSSSTTGSTPQRVGAKMLVFGDGRIVGTIGGGCYENDAFGKAREAITHARAAARALRAVGRLRAGDRPHLRRTDGRLHRADRAVARAVHRRRRPRRLPPRAHRARSRLPRPRRRRPREVRQRERFPTATEIVVDDIPAWIARARIPPHAYVVIVTRGHTNDLEALRALAPRDLRYLGPDRQPREGRAHLRRADGRRRCRPSR